MGSGIPVAAGLAARRRRSVPRLLGRPPRTRPWSQGGPGTVGVVSQGDRDGRQRAYRGQRVDADASNQSHRPACRRRSMGDDSTGTCSLMRRVTGTGHPGSGRGGISPASPAALARTRKPHTPGRPIGSSHTGRAFGHLPAPGPTHRSTHSNRSSRSAGGNLDPDPPRPDTRPGAAGRYIVGRSRRGAGGGLHRSTRRRAHLAGGAAAPGRRAVAAPAPFPGRPEPLAQDRSGAGRRPQSTRRLALLRASARPPSWIPGAVDPRPPLRHAHRAARRGRRGCLQSVGCLVPRPGLRRRPQSAGRRANPMQLRATAGRGPCGETARARQRALDRSRRNTNPDQYGPSVRQHKRAERRAAHGLQARQVSDPGGARHARADGRPVHGYRHDQLSARYRMIRADHATATRAASQAKQARAHEVAAAIVAAHGNAVTVEDCRISTWARLWGKRIALFSPGMFVAALAAECAASGGRLSRAGTRTTAMSQHCLCGARVPKTLAQRTHHCPECGLRGDRDVVSAVLAACVDLADPDDPRTAAVDYRLTRALRDGLASQQEREGSVNRHRPPTAPAAGSARTGSHPAVASAEHAAPGPPSNRPDTTPGRHGTSRKQPAPKLIGAA